MTNHSHRFGLQIFARGSIPDGSQIEDLYDWGFPEEFWYWVPDAQLYLIDAYALGLMHSMADGSYRWADRGLTARSETGRLVRDCFGEADPGDIRLHRRRYAELLRSAWSLGAGEEATIRPGEWRRRQAVAEAFYSVRDAEDDWSISPPGVGMAIAAAYSSWGGKPILDSLLKRLCARRYTVEEWEEGGDDLCDDHDDRTSGALLKLLYLAYDLGHPEANAPHLAGGRLAVAAPAADPEVPCRERGTAARVRDPD